MTGVVHPVGPESAEVYWRRRIFVILGFVVVLAVVGKVIFGGSDAKPQAAITHKPTTKPAVVSTPQSTPTKNVVPIVDPTRRSVAGTCHDADIKVIVSSVKHVTTVGDGLSLTLKVTNQSEKKCTRDLGSGANEVTITSGPALVWSTDHCNPSTASDVQTLAPGKSWSVNVIWDGKISATKCQLMGAAQHGAYWVHAHNGKVQAHAMRFVVN